MAVRETKKKSGQPFYLLCILFILTGCIEQAPVRSGDVLIRVGESVATGEDFNKALENAKAAYSRGTLQDSAVFKQIRLSVLNQMVEEMVVREVAKIHGIQVTDAELEAAVERLKQDYPEGEFDRVLLERAVSYESWKKSLKIRLLAEKVAATILGDQIVVTPEDIAEYYAFYGTERSGESPGSAQDKIEDEKILNYLRKEKIVKAYGIWINNLKREMSIEVNRDKWAAILEIDAGDQEKRQVSAEDPRY